MLEILLEIGTNGEEISSKYEDLKNIIENFYFYIYDIKQTLVVK